MAFSHPIGNIVQLVMNTIFADQTGQQWNEFQAAIEQQIAAGLSVGEARTQAAMQLFDTSPDFQAARDTFQTMYETLPKQARADYDTIINESREDRAKFNQGAADLTKGYAGRERAVMGFLNDVGNQELKDIERTFGEQQGAAMSNLDQQGLSGSGVGASIAGGFATRKADSLARSREATGQMKANALAGLRGDTLGFGAGALQFDAGLGRDTRSERERALATAYGLETGLGSQYGNLNYDLGQSALDTFTGTTGDYMDFVQNVTQYPPPTDHVAEGFASVGRGFAPR